MKKTSTHSLDDTLELMRDLRARCEWDAAQTHESLRPYLIEEAHELDEAIRHEDDKLVREELGDVLLQVLFHSVMAEERGAFSFADVAEGLITKMRGRHPHLYGDAAKEPWGYGVATVAEGEELRDLGVARPVVVFTPLLAEELTRVRSARLTPTLGFPEVRAQISAGGKNGGGARD